MNSMKFTLTLKVHYKTEIGQQVAIVGNIDELGNWNDHTRCKLRWTEGHVWESDNLDIQTKSYFLYKYVILEDGKIKQWERGANRIADLYVLPEVQDGLDTMSRSPSIASM
mmetsp:Transcript_13675/g.21431  ORF Transcript_13675/g.21431 Transcript_13675/m.21431 type:complete len:111 (+) Transcript_13675:301-633(+)